MSEIINAVGIFLGASIILAVIAWISTLGIRRGYRGEGFR